MKNMQIELKETDMCKFDVKYIADAGEILNKRGDVLKLFKNAPVKGFRKGKASLDAIKAQYKDQIEEALKRALAEDAYHNTLFEKKIKPYGPPQFSSITLADGKFVCDFSLHSRPDFELAEYKGLEIPEPAQEITDLELTEKMIQELRKKYGEVSPYSDSDSIEYGDNVIIDYEAFIDGQKIENLSAQGEMITVGGTKLDNFDEQLIGMTLSQTKEFTIHAPENGLPSLSGKLITFKVTLNMGSKTELCALDDSFAKKVGKETYQELRSFISNISMARVEANKKTSINTAIASRLVADHSFEIPQWLSLSEAQYLASASKVNFDSLSNEDKSQYMKMAEKNVKLALVLDKIRTQEPEAQLMDQEIHDIIKQNLFAKLQDENRVNDSLKEMNKTGYISILFSRIKDEYTLDFISKQSKILN